MPDAADPGATLPLKRAQKSALVTGAANPDAVVPYVFGPEIARGGMGSLLQAEDCKIGCTVAVKIMLSELDANEDEKQRFINEAAVLGKLAHPNIVPVYDIGRDAEGHLYYSMKLVKGRTLKAIINQLRDGGESGEGILPFPLSAVSGTGSPSHYTLAHLLTIFRKVCDAMAFAHSNGIIHRDLKPENIMVGEFGEVLVMDWGLAKVLDEPCAARSDGILPSPMARCHHSSELAPGSSLGMTLEGSVMGGPQYMSPEQAAGHISDMDARSDIFSLGGILYTILTLRPPAEGKTLEEVLQKVISGEIEPLHQGRTAPLPSGQKEGRQECRPSLPIPAALAAVTMKALSLDKTRRYQNVAAFSGDIEAYQAGFATRAENARLTKQIILLLRRHKGAFGTAFAALFVLGAMGVWFIISITASEHKATRNAEIAQANEKRAEANEQQAIAEKENVRQALAKSALALAEAARREGNGPEMQAALNDVPDDLRDSTWHYLLDQSDTSIARVRTGTNEMEGVAAHPGRPGGFTPDGQQILTWNYGDDFRLVNARDGALIRTFKAARKKISALAMGPTARLPRRTS